MVIETRGGRLFCNNKKKKRKREIERQPQNSSHNLNIVVVGVEGFDCAIPRLRPWPLFFEGWFTDVARFGLQTSKQRSRWLFPIIHGRYVCAFFRFCAAEILLDFAVIFYFLKGVLPLSSRLRDDWWSLGLFFSLGVSFI